MFLTKTKATTINKERRKSQKCNKMAATFQDLPSITMATRKG